VFGGGINKTVDQVLKISNLKSKQKPGAAGVEPHNSFGVVEEDGR
jgi:hypothetical protein